MAKNAYISFQKNYKNTHFENFGQLNRLDTFFRTGYQLIRFPRMGIQGFFFLIFMNSRTFLDIKRGKKFVKNKVTKKGKKSTEV